MASAIRKRPGILFLIATFNVPVEHHLQRLQSLNAEITADVRAMSDKTCVVILDMRDRDLTCSDFTPWIEEYRRGAYPLFDYPLLTVFAVGTQPVLFIGIKKIERQLKTSMTAFGTITAAIDGAQQIVSEVERV